MEVRNLIKPSATVVKITQISKGDVYKRLETPSYGEAKVVFGVVIDVLDNGEQSSLVALEFTPVNYSNDIKAVTKVFSGSSDVAIFPATVEEYQKALRDAMEEQARLVDAANKDFIAKKAVLDLMEAQRSAALTAPAMQEITA